MFSAVLPTAEMLCSTGFPGGSNSKESTCSAGDPGSVPGSGRSPGGGHGYLPTPVFLLGELHGQKSLVGYSLWGHKESAMTERQSSNWAPSRGFTLPVTAIRTLLLDVRRPVSCSPEIEACFEPVRLLWLLLALGTGSQGCSQSLRTEGQDGASD